MLVMAIIDNLSERLLYRIVVYTFFIVFHLFHGMLQSEFVLRRKLCTFPPERTFGSSIFGDIHFLRLIISPHKAQSSKFDSRLSSRLRMYVRQPK